MGRFRRPVVLAFDDMDNIIDMRAANQFRSQLARLVELARIIGSVWNLARVAPSIKAFAMATMVMPW